MKYVPAWIQKVVALVGGSELTIASRSSLGFTWTPEQESCAAAAGKMWTSSTTTMVAVKPATESTANGTFHLSFIVGSPSMLPSTYLPAPRAMVALARRHLLPP